jgi:hypothetical protein
MPRLASGLSGSLERAQRISTPGIVLNQTDRTSCIHGIEGQPRYDLRRLENRPTMQARSKTQARRSMERDSRTGNPSSATAYAQLRNDPSADTFYEKSIRTIQKVSRHRGRNLNHAEIQPNQEFRDYSTTWFLARNRRRREPSHRPS